MRYRSSRRTPKGHGKLDLHRDSRGQGGTASGQLLALRPARPRRFQAMIDVLERCFKDRISTPEWQSAHEGPVALSYGPQSLIQRRGNWAQAEFVAVPSGTLQLRR